VAARAERNAHGSGFPRRMRLTHDREFRAVYEEGRRQWAAPLLIVARPNGLGFNRLGLSVSRRQGRAVTRNRMKRLIREAFRLAQHDLPQGYDLVVSVRAAEPRTLGAYRAALTAAALALDRRWTSQPQHESLESGERPAS
jgi:ribonuclease P protein component